MWDVTGFHSHPPWNEWRLQLQRLTRSDEGLLLRLNDTALMANYIDIDHDQMAASVVIILN
jgi:hypothetical protein